MQIGSNGQSHSIFWHECTSHLSTLIWFLLSPLFSNSFILGRSLSRVICYRSRVDWRSNAVEASVLSFQRWFLKQRVWKYNHSSRIRGNVPLPLTESRQ